MRRSIMMIYGVFVTSLAVTAPTRAGTSNDPKNDYLPSYVGPLLRDLDVTRLSVTFDRASSVFTLDTRFAGAIDPTKLGFYVFGVNTGTGPIRPFGAIGEPNVIFNQAIVVRKDGSGTIGATALDPAAIVIDGNDLRFSIAASLLPSTGFAFEHYGFNLWPRIGIGNNNQITDFAPENATLSATPEPSAWLLLVAGFGVIGVTLRSRRQRIELAAS